MKKILFLSGLLLSGMTFVACSDDYTDWASPQSNPQESAITLPGFSAAAVEPINLADVEDGASILMFTLSTVSLPEGYTVGNTRMEVTPVDDATAEAITIETDNGYVTKEELQETIEQFYGKRPEARTFNAQIYSDIIFEGQSFLVDAGVVTLTLTPVAPFIASAYYLVGDMCGWDEDTMIPFTHSDEDVYADPVFTVSFSTEDNKYWKIIPQTNIDSGDFWHEGEDGVVGVLVDGDKSLEGTLVAVAGVGAGCIADAGLYRMTINMMDYTYVIEAVASEYYMTGSPNGWASDYSALLFPLSTTEYSYTTYYTASWDFKFWELADVGDWDNIYGCPAATDGVGNWDGSIVYSYGDQGTIGCITSPSAGYYTVYINMGSMTYYWEELADQSPAEYGLVSITGDFNGWGDYLDMTQVAPHNWYYEGNIPSEGGLKFLVDHDWAVNWGADQNVGDNNAGVAVQDGSNITVPAGDYRIYLNDINGQFVFIKQ